LNSISGVQRWHTIQHSLPSWTSPHHLKLWPCGKQIAQHISWSQGHSTSLLISEFILRTSTPVWTVPDKITLWLFKTQVVFLYYFQKIRLSILLVFLLSLLESQSCSYSWPVLLYAIILKRCCLLSFEMFLVNCTI